MINFYDIAYGIGLGLSAPYWLIKPSARRKVLKAFDQRIKFLKDVIDGKAGDVAKVNGEPVLVDGKPLILGADISDRLKAMDLLGKYGGNLAAENSVAWMFDKKGYIVVEKAKADEETLLAAAIDAGADDMRDDGDSWEIVSAPDAFQKVLEAVKALGVEPGAAEVAMLPQNYVKLEGKTAQQMVKLMEALEEHDDTKKVWSNADIEEKEIEASLA